MVFIVLARTAQPLPFGSPDGTVTDIFFLMCCQDDRIHLHVLARVCMMCRHTHLLRDLRAQARRTEPKKHRLAGAECATHR